MGNINFISPYLYGPALGVLGINFCFQRRAAKSDADAHGTEGADLGLGKKHKVAHVVGFAFQRLAGGIEHVFVVANLGDRRLNLIGKDKNLPGGLHLGQGHVISGFIEQGPGRRRINMDADDGELAAAQFLNQVFLLQLG